jgi:hypothetical protein
MDGKPMLRYLPRLLVFLCLAVAARAERAFELRFLDADTQRGVPLVEAWTVNGIPYVSDSHGRIAFDEPGLLGQVVYFKLRCHGYEVPKDGFGFAGIRRPTRPGGRAVIRLKRINVAERLYRITGQGIYADSSRLGHSVPIKEPLLNAFVVGQDSSQATVYRGKVRWFWGDTSKPAHPLGQFQTSGAVALLPEGGGLKPEVGIDLEYFAGTDGFSRPMAPMAGGGLVWIDGLLVVKDEQGDEVMLAHFSRRKDLETQLEHGLARYNDTSEVFEPVKILEKKNTWRHPRGQVTRHEDQFYFAHPFATTRVPARLDAVLDPDAYEALSRVAGEQGGLAYGWQAEDGPVDQTVEAERLKRSALTEPKPQLQLWDAATGVPVKAHAGSIRWNAHRRRWILICAQVGGRSFLGETWYAEAGAISGPWGPATRIVTHEKYSFYNPVQHAFLDQAGGRYIYFEGTYTKMFSGNPVPTPRYDYNQILYRLDLEDPRLRVSRVK